MPAFEIISCGGDTILKNKYGIYSKNEIETQLREGHLTIDDLASVYKLKSYQMVHVLRTLNISFRNTLSDTRIINSFISPSLHQVLLGTLLGDAYMQPKTYFLGHGIYQMEYCYHVAEKFHQFVASFGEKLVKSKTEKCFNFWTYRHDIFSSYYNRFYSRGKGRKLITLDTAPDLEAEGLAYWFMDDGKYGPSGFHISVGDITAEEGSILIDLLHNKFGIKSTFQNHDIEKGYHTIYIKAESRSRFLDIISPYIIPSMTYKITGSERPCNAYDEDKIIARHIEFCNKAGRLIRYSGNSRIHEAVVSRVNVVDSKNQYIGRILESIKNGTQISRTNIRKPPQKDELIRLLEQGLTDQQIASQYGLGRNRIAEMRRSLKIGKKSTRLTSDQRQKIEGLLKAGATIKQIMEEMHLSFYNVKKFIAGSRCHQYLMKQRYLDNDLKSISFNPNDYSISDYVFSKEDYSDELADFLRRYEWLGSVGVYPKWCFTMRLNGVLAGLQLFNEPTAYSRILGDKTIKLECLIQRGCTISWAHQHLGSKMLMASINWMVQNTDKRVFIGYSDPKAGEIGTIYQACNFKYLGDNFGIDKKYSHPTYRNGKEFCAHSLRRTSVFKWWCKQNNIEIQPSWIKPNGFKDLSKIPMDVKRAWYDWGNQIIRESKSIDVSRKGKYVLICGKDRREQRALEALFQAKVFPYPKRD